MLRVFRKTTRSSSQSGFTLVEVMVCVFLFTVVTLIFSGTIVASHKASRLSGQYAQATSLCQHKIDQMRSVGYGAMTYNGLKDAGIINPADASMPYTFPEEDEIDRFFPDSETEIWVQQEAYDSQIMRVTVRLRWKNVVNEDRESSITLVCRIANVEF